MEDYLIVKSLGYGVMQVTAPTLTKAVSAAEQIGPVLEAWSDPGSEELHTVIVGGPVHATSKYEAAIARDPEVAQSVLRAVAASPPGSAARAALRRVSDAVVSVDGGQPVEP